MSSFGGRNRPPNRPPNLPVVILRGRALPVPKSGQRLNQSRHSAGLHRRIERRCRFVRISISRFPEETHPETQPRTPHAYQAGSYEHEFGSEVLTSLLSRTSCSARRAFTDILRTSTNSLRI